MSRLLRELEADLERLGAGGFFASPAAVAREAIELLTPPERISITDCAAQHRLIPNAEGGARLWSAALTPYVNGIQDAIDDPLVRVIVVVGPGRTGKTLAAENALFKRMKFGPATDVLWYLPGALLDDYLDTTVAPMFEFHPDIMAKIGKGKSDNKRNLKKVGQRFIRYFAANKANIASKQAPFIVGDEIDLYPKQIRSNFRQQIAIRQRAYGNIGKGFMCSHPDAGWNDGIASAYSESVRGRFYWPCPHCADWSSPAPDAEWRTKLDYERPKGMAADDLLDHVARTACLICPHCGGAILTEDRAQMLSLGRWVFDGEIIAPDGTVTGRPKQGDTRGFWIHGTMSPFVSLGQLAREYVGALVLFERTGKSARLREVTAKSLGEVYKDAGAAGVGLDPARLKRRVKEAAESEQDGKHRLRQVPRWVLFLTAAVDVGGSKFDVLVRGWGADGESCIVDRFTINDGPDGSKIAPGLRQQDWLVIRDRVMLRSYPIAGRPGWVRGIASTGIDTGGVPGATWKAYEFARQMKRTICAGPDAYKLRLFKGASDPKAAEISDGTGINRDDNARPVLPVVTLYLLGVHKLKELEAERLAIDSPGPGYVHLPVDMDPRHIEEITNESLVDGVWDRNGDNETWDLMIYNEAVRLKLKPDRPGIDWTNRPPSWGRAVNTQPFATDAEPAAPKAKAKGASRLAAMNARA